MEGMDFASAARTAENRTKWKGVVAKSSVVSQRPSKVVGLNRIIIETTSKGTKNQSDTDQTAHRNYSCLVVFKDVFI